MSRYFALLPAAGVGARMGVSHPKQYLEIHGKPMIWHAIHALHSHFSIAQVYVVIAPDDLQWDSHDWSEFPRLAVLRQGGATRAQSVMNGLAAIAAEVEAEDWILVHDAARPCLTRALLDKLIAELSDDPVGGILAVPVADTLKREGEARRIAATVSREGLWGAQTPQMFPHALLLRALEQAGNEVTDEASAVEAMGLAPRLVKSDPGNLKVTVPHDLEIAAWLLGRY